MILLIFDIDGTITDTANIDDYFFKKTFLDLYNLEISDEKWLNYQIITSGSDSGMAAEIMRNELKTILEPHILQNIKNYFISELMNGRSANPDKFKPLPGATELIAELRKRRNCRVAIATGCWKDSALIKLKAAGIDYEDYPLSTADLFFSKYDIIKNSLLESKRIYNTDFDVIIYIGDSRWDYNASNELGLEFIGIDSSNSGVLNSLGVKYVLPDFTDKDTFFSLLNKIKLSR